MSDIEIAHNELRNTNQMYREADSILQNLRYMDNAEATAAVALSVQGLTLELSKLRQEIENFMDQQRSF